MHRGRQLTRRDQLLHSLTRQPCRPQRRFASVRPGRPCCPCCRCCRCLSLMDRMDKMDTPDTTTAPPGRAV